MKEWLRYGLACSVTLGTFACGAPRVTSDAAGTDAANGLCGRGLVVVASDYQSTNVSLLGFDGSVLSPSLISSRTQSGGFGLALSGDVVPPSSAMSGPDAVLIDRTPAGVLRFVSFAGATVTGELPVGTGFSANPHDYLALTASKAYVSRYDSNPSPGQQAFDGGGDVLIVDPSTLSISGRIDLSPAMNDATGFTPNPGRIALVRSRVFVLLASFAADYMSATTSRVVELDPNTDAILSTTLLDGLRGCDALAVAPDQTQLAIACTGADLADSPPRLAAAGVALLDVTGVPVVQKTFPATQFGQNPLGFSLDFIDQRTLLFGTLGFFASDAVTVASLDSVIRLDTESGDFQQVLTSESQPFTLGDLRCERACGACFVADAARAGGSVLRLPLDDQGGLGDPEPLRAETQIGLPPRYLGVF